MISKATLLLALIGLVSSCASLLPAGDYLASQSGQEALLELGRGVTTGTPYQSWFGPTGLAASVLAILGQWWNHRRLRETQDKQRRKNGEIHERINKASRSG